MLVSKCCHAVCYNKRMPIGYGHNCPTIDQSYCSACRMPCEVTDSEDGYMYLSESKPQCLSKCHNAPTIISKGIVKCLECGEECGSYNSPIESSTHVKVLEWLYLHNNDYSGKFTWRKDFISFSKGIDNGQKVVEWLYLHDNTFSSGKEWKKELLAFLKTVL